MKCSDCCRCRWHMHLTNHGYFDRGQNLNRRKSLTPRNTWHCCVGSPFYICGLTRNSHISCCESSLLHYKNMASLFGISILYLWLDKTHISCENSLLHSTSSKLFFPCSFCNLSLFILNRSPGFCQLFWKLHGCKRGHERNVFSHL